MGLPRATTALLALIRTRGHGPVADATTQVLCSRVTTEARALSVSWARSWHRPILQHAVTVPYTRSRRRRACLATTACVSRTTMGPREGQPVGVPAGTEDRMEARALSAASARII